MRAPQRESGSELGAREDALADSVPRLADAGRVREGHRGQPPQDDLEQVFADDFEAVATLRIGLRHLLREVRHSRNVT